MYQEKGGVCAAIGMLLMLATGAAAAEWTDRTQDIYIDGRRDHDAQVLSDSERYAVFAEALPRVFVIDLENLSVASFDKQELHLAADRSSATSEAAPRPLTGATCIPVAEDGYLITTTEHSLLVTPHQGRAGAMELAELWREAPVWRSLAAAYEPDPATVATLRAVDRDVELVVAYGTWCGDSKRHVPRLLKALQEAGNPRLDLRLTSIARRFRDPLDFVREHKIVNVPTVLVFEDGREIGRIVETPAGDSLEADLAAILTGRPPVHTGRWQRDRLLARGRYHYLDAAGERRGDEDWELFSDDEDGRLLHCRTRVGERSTEVWQRRDREGRTVFVEITRQEPAELSRSRYWIEDGRLRSITRGDATGILEQIAELPAGPWTALPPATAAVGQPGSAQTGRDSRSEGTLLRLPGTGAAGARMGPVVFETGEGREIDTPAGRFTAEPLVVRSSGRTSRYWLHPELGVPVTGETEASGRVVLAELEIPASRGTP